MTTGLKRDASGSIINNPEARPVSGNPYSANAANSSKSTKRFECNFVGCKKSYTRAEHLGRHQLNHNPKDIYRCNFPGCTRTFVRQDLCVRHRERHDAPASKTTDSPSTDEEEGDGSTRRVGRPRLSSLNRNGSRLGKTGHLRVVSTSSEDNQVIDPSITSKQAALSSPQSYVGPPTQINPNTSSGQANASMNYPSSRTQIGSSGNVNGYSVDMLSSHPSTILAADRAPHHTHAEYALPALDLHASPTSIRDEFTAWLFDEQFPTTSGGPFFNTTMNVFGSLSTEYMPFGNTPMFADCTNDAGLPSDLGFDTTASSSEFEIMTTDDIAWISSSKRSRLLDLVRSRFIDAENKDITSLRHEVFQEDTDSEDHVLSLRSMQLYLGSYWKHFHRQLPILHQPTFSADGANDLLILAVMAIGASCLGARHGRMKTTAASRFATFVAWHLRWQIFMHVDFRPPAKLWVFQTLLLLEVYEKQCSTRQMHERAHVHSATMINLMRRGTTLVGEDETQRRTPVPSTPDAAWHRWIETESTRRAAFAAFVIDATYAEMFGHAAIMVVHEIKLPLPCDDALWSATSAAEVGRVHASLHTHGIKPTTFLDGLKRTLTGKKVKTNNFGRTILMAGLLSITWHLNQRDLQVSSLGASSALGMPGIWREALAKSLDFWKRDFDDSMSHMKNVSLPWQQITSWEDRDACAAAGVLHHFSHVTLHTDILDCQIYSGAQKLFGRVISRADRDRAKHKMGEWIRTSSARCAAFHAIQIVKPIVMLASSSQDFYNCRNDYLLNRAWAVYYASLVLFCFGYGLDGPLHPFPDQLLVQNTYLSPDWNAEMPTESQFQSRLEDAQIYLNTVGSANTPDDLLLLQGGRNRIVGLLGLFAQSLCDSRWELLQEGAQRINRAMQILRGSE